MPILIHCPDCGAKIRAPEQAIGRQIRCPKCDAEFTAKSEGAPAPEPAPPPPAPEPVGVGVTPPPEPMEATKPARIDYGRRELPPEDDEEEDEEEPLRPPPPSAAVAPSNPLVDFLLFRTMISPIIIQAIFWLGVIASIGVGGYCLVSAIGVMVGGTDPLFAFLRALLGLGMIVFGPLVIRVCCELTILYFRIYDSLREIHADLEKQRRPE